MARLQYTIDDNLKKKAETILQTQGLPPKVAVKMFYIEIINQGGLPFNPSKVKIPNDITLETFDKTDKGLDLAGPFHNPDELFKNLDS